MENLDKTLPEILDKLPPTVMVHLGAKSSFIYIAPAQTMRSAGYIDTLSNSLFENWQRSERRTRQSLLSALESPPRWNKEKKLNPKNYKDNVDEFLKDITVWRNRIKQALADFTSAANAVNAFVPLKDRRVIEVRKRLEGDGVIVLVSGEEVGKLWFAGEIPTEIPETSPVAS